MIDFSPKPTMPNYLEYCDLLDNYSYPELLRAYNALSSSEKQDILYAEESALLIFLIDTKKQEQLYLYFEDMREAFSNNNLES